MKKILATIFLLVALSTLSFTQINYDDHLLEGSTLILQKGSVLTYEVNLYGDVYDFIVKIKKYDEQGIEFDYEMTNDRNTSGNVKFTKDAFENAHMLYNYFAGGPVSLTDATTVWVSKKVFAELLSGTSTISSNEGETYDEVRPVGVFHDFEAFNKLSNSTINDITYLYATSEDESAKYWIHFSKSNPLILGMDLGWTIWLKEIGRM